MSDMICPNCDREMEDKSYWYYGISDWDMDYPATHHEEYYCNSCKIRYVHGKWEFPQHIQLATEKQIRTVHFINSKLGTNCTPLLKRQCWRFISKYFDEAKEVASCSRDDDPAYDDLYDMFEEYY